MARKTSSAAGGAARVRARLVAQPGLPGVKCHTCAGVGFYWRDDPDGELGRFPVKCGDCPAFGSLPASQRLIVARLSNDARRRIERRDAAKNPRWFDEGPRK